MNVNGALQTVRDEERCVSGKMSTVLYDAPVEITSQVT